MKEYPAEWIAALRSGKYKQGKGALRDSTGAFCCLGLLCELEDPSKWNDAYWEIERGGVLPRSIAAKIGILESRRKGVLVIGQKDTYETLLTELNDEGFSFSQIADVIEHFWRDL